MIIDSIGTKPLNSYIFLQNFFAALTRLIFEFMFHFRFIQYIQFGRLLKTNVLYPLTGRRPGTSTKPYFIENVRSRTYGRVYFAFYLYIHVHHVKMSTALHNLNQQIIIPRHIGVSYFLALTNIYNVNKGYEQISRTSL